MPTPLTAAAVKELLGAGTGAAAGGSNGSSSLVVGTWYLVGPDVASIRTRVTTGGTTGPWVVSSAVGGFVYRRVEIPSIPADGYVVDTEVVSREGTVISVEGVTGRATSLGVMGSRAPTSDRSWKHERHARRALGQEQDEMRVMARDVL